MERLDIVNKMLIHINARPINSLDTKQPDATSAILTLDRVIKREQVRGWFFNTNKNVTYIRDNNGVIELPVNVASIIPENKDIILKERKLYDKYNKTFAFDEDQTLTKEVLIVEYEELPLSFRFFIAELASAEFVSDVINDKAKEMSLKEQAAREFMNLHREQLATEKYNIFDNKDIQSRFVGLWPYRK